MAFLLSGPARRLAELVAAPLADGVGLDSLVRSGRKPGRGSMVRRHCCLVHHGLLFRDTIVVDRRSLGLSQRVRGL